MLNASAAPGSYLGMDPAFLVWIPPLASQEADGQAEKQVKEGSQETSEKRISQISVEGASLEPSEYESILSSRPGEAKKDLCSSKNCKEIILEYKSKRSEGSPPIYRILDKSYQVDPSSESAIRTCLISKTRCNHQSKVDQTNSPLAIVKEKDERGRSQEDLPRSRLIDRVTYLDENGCEMEKKVPQTAAVLRKCEGTIEPSYTEKEMDVFGVSNKMVDTMQRTLSDDQPCSPDHGVEIDFRDKYQSRKSIYEILSEDDLKFADDDEDDQEVDA